MTIAVDRAVKPQHKQTNKPNSLFISAEKIIGKQTNDTFLTWHGRRHDILCANRSLTGVTITFSRSLVHVTGVVIGQGVLDKLGDLIFVIFTLCAECSLV